MLLVVGRTLARMSGAFPGAVVTGFERLEAGLELPDSDGRHVSAAAIVSPNLGDFSAEQRGSVRRHRIG